MTIYHLLGIAGIRFLLFEYRHWQPLRDKLLGGLKEVEFVKKFLNCPFCQGFWLGIIYNFYQLYFNSIGVADFILFSFATAMFCYVLYYFVDSE